MSKSRINAALDMYFEMTAEHPQIFGNSSCGYEMCCGNRVVVTDYETGMRYVAPDEETAAQFTDRIRRSIETGRNLFFEEWNKVRFRNDVLY